MQDHRVAGTLVVLVALVPFAHASHLNYLNYAAPYPGALLPYYPHYYEKQACIGNPACLYGGYGVYAGYGPWAGRGQGYAFFRVRTFSVTEAVAVQATARYRLPSPPTANYYIIYGG